MERNILYFCIYALLFAGAILAGIFLIGPSLRQKTPNELKEIAFGWVVILAICTAAQYVIQRSTEGYVHLSVMRLGFMPCWFILALTSAFISSRRKHKN